MKLNSNIAVNASTGQNIFIRVKLSARCFISDIRLGSFRNHSHDV